MHTTRVAWPAGDEDATGHEDAPAPVHHPDAPTWRDAWPADGAPVAQPPDAHTHPWYEGIEQRVSDHLASLSQAAPLPPLALAELTDEVQLVTATFDSLARPSFFSAQFSFMLGLASRDWKGAAVYAARHAQFWAVDAPHRGGPLLLAWKKIGEKLLALAGWDGEPVSPAVQLPGTGIAEWGAEWGPLPTTTATSEMDADLATLTSTVGVAPGANALVLLDRIESRRVRPTLALAEAVVRIMDADAAWKANAGLQIMAFALAVLAPADADDPEADDERRWGIVARLLWIQGPVPTLGVVVFAFQSSHVLQRALPIAPWFWRGLVHAGIGLVQLLGAVVDDALLLTLGCALNCTAWDLLAARLDPQTQFAVAWRLTTANHSADTKTQGPLLMWPRLLRQLLLWCPTLPAQRAAWNETALLHVQFTSLQLDASRGQGKRGLPELMDTIRADYFPDQTPAEDSAIAWAALRILEPGEREPLAGEFAAAYETPTPPLRLRKLIDIAPRGNPAVGAPIPFRTRWRLPNAMRPTAWLKKRPSQRGVGAFDWCGDGDALYVPFTRTEGLYYTQTNHPFSGAFGFFEPTSSVLVDVSGGRVFVNKLHAAMGLVAEARTTTSGDRDDDVADAVETLRAKIAADAHRTAPRLAVTTGTSHRETVAALRNDRTELGYTDQLDEALLTVARWLDVPVLIFQREPNETSFATEIAIAVVDARDALCAKRGNAELGNASSLAALPLALAGSVWLPGAHGAFAQGAGEAEPVALSLVAEPDGSMRIRRAGPSPQDPKRRRWTPGPQ